MENHPPEGRLSIRILTLAWHICFIILNKPQFAKISMKTTMTAGRSRENRGRFAGGHFAGGHDGMANLCKPITAIIKMDDLLFKGYSSWLTISGGGHAQ